jgi:hypothetical protein
MDDEMRAKVSALLEAVVTADGVIRPEERDFVRRAANRWKLPDPEAPLSLRTLGSATEARGGSIRLRKLAYWRCSWMRLPSTTTSIPASTLCSSPPRPRSGSRRLLWRSACYND